MFRLPPAVFSQRLEKYQPRPFVDLGTMFSEFVSGRMDRFLLRFRFRRSEKPRPVMPVAPVLSPASDTASVHAVVVSTPEVTPSQSTLPPGGVIAWSDADFAASVEIVPTSGVATPVQAPRYEGLTRSATTKATKNARRKDVRMRSSAGKMASSSSRDGMRLSASHSTRPKRKNMPTNKRHQKAEALPLELNETLYQQIVAEVVQHFRADRVDHPQMVIAEILKMETGRTEDDVGNLVEQCVLEYLRAGVEKKRAQDVTIDRNILRKMAKRAMDEVVGRAWKLLKSATAIDEDDPLHRRARRRHRQGHGDAEKVYLSRLGDAGALCFFIAQEGHKQLIRGVTVLDNISRWLPAV